MLLVGATLNPSTLNAANKAALDAFLARRGGVVGLGTAGAAFGNNASLLSVTATTGQSLVSGVANVVNHGGPVVNGAQPYAWIFPATWFSDLGSNAVVEQSYAADPLLSGWWRPSNATNGQAQAAGKASVVRAVAPGGTGVVLIGTSPTVRLHAKGLQPQLGRALLWAASQTTGTTSPRPRRRHRARDAGADARHAGDVRRVHAGRRDGVHRGDDRQRDLDRR